MDVELFMQYVRPELLVLVPALNAVGAFLKKTEHVNDKYIPLLLGIAGVVLALIYVISTSAINDLESALESIFTAIVQGVLTAFAAVGGHQLYKQSKEQRS